MRGIKVAGCLWVIATTLLGGTAWAQGTPAPVAPGDSTTLKRELDEVFLETLHDPTNIDLTLRYARLATQLGDYEASITALERLLFFNPALARPRLELGVLYYRLGSYGLARSYLEQARNAADLPADSAALIDSYLADIAKRESRHRFTGEVFTGLLHESNANFGPLDSNIRVLGINIPLPGQFTKKTDQSWVTSGAALYSYDLENQDHTTIEATARAFFSRHARAHDFDLVSLEGTIGPRTTFASWGAPDFSLHPYLIADYVHLGGDPFFHAFGFGIEAIEALTPNLALKGIYEMHDRRFNGPPTRPTATDLSGVSNAIALQVAYALTPNQQVTATASYSNDSTRTVFQDNDRFGISAGYQVAYLPEFRFGDTPLLWSSAASIGRFIYGYGGPDPTIDPDMTRFDRVWRFNFAQGIPVTELIGFNLQLQYERVRSSIVNFSYNNYSILFGPQLRF